jgi:putative flippase GtrA
VTLTVFAQRITSAARPLRFIGTGAVAAVVQLTLLALFSHRGLDGLMANALAFLLAAQVNFALSSSFTWRDRSRTGSLLHRWMLFHCSISLMAVVNMLTFAVARTVVPLLEASVAGILMAAVGNYLIGDRLVFRTRRANEPIQQPGTSAA